VEKSNCVNAQMKIKVQVGTKKERKLKKQKNLGRRIWVGPTRHSMGKTFPRRETFLDPQGGWDEGLQGEKLGKKKEDWPRGGRREADVEGLDQTQSRDTEICLFPWPLTWCPKRKQTNGKTKEDETGGVMLARTHGLMGVWSSDRSLLE